MRLITVATLSLLFATAAQAGDAPDVHGLLDQLGKGTAREKAAAAKKLTDLDAGALVGVILDDDGKIVGKLTDLAELTDSKVVSKAAEAAIGSVVPRLRETLTAAGSDMKLEALGALTGLGERSSGALGSVASLLGDGDQDSAVRAAAATALGSIGDDAGGVARKALERAVGDGDESVRSAAEAALGKLES